MLADAVRAKLREMDPGLLARFETLDEAIGRMSAGSRFNGMLVGSFAAIAFLMAVIGVYSVLAFAVAQRTQEIGIRMALGAGPGSVQSLVLKEGAVLVAIGTIVGLAASLLVSRYLKTLLYDISATDVRTYLAMARGNRDRGAGGCVGAGAAGSDAGSDGGAAALLVTRACESGIG